MEMDAAGIWNRFDSLTPLLIKRFRGVSESTLRDENPGRKDAASAGDSL